MTKDIPDWCVAAGNPCRVLRKITEDDRKKLFHDEEIDPEAFCRCCGEVFNPEEEQRVCPGCGMGDYELLHGKELTVKELGFE